MNMFTFLLRYFKGNNEKRRATKLRAKQQKKADEFKAKEEKELARKRYTYRNRHLDIERYRGAERQQRVNWWARVAHRRLKRLIAMNTNRKRRGLFEYKTI